MADKRTLKDSIVRSLKPAPTGRRLDVMDTVVPGFGVRITDTGAKSYILVARFPPAKHPTRRTIGDVNRVGLAEARRIARSWLEEIAAGVDPRARQLAEQAAALAAAEAEEKRAANTFGSVAEAFIGQRTNRRAEADAQEIRRSLVSAWKDRPIASITAADVRRRFEDIKKRSAYEARNAWGHASLIFKTAVHDGLIEASPLASLDKRLVFAGARIVQRDRVLSDDELFAYWRAANRLGYPYGPLFKLLALTGQRDGMVARAQWREFHPELVRLLRDRKPSATIDWNAVPDAWKVWSVPGSKMKSGRPHLVPLGGEALDVLESLPHFKAGDFLFSTRSGRAPVNGFSKAKERLDRRMVRSLRAIARGRGATPAALDPFVLHDLRRTLRTGLSALRVDYEVREAVIGHVKKGLDRTYDQHDFLDEKREALTAWARRLRSIVDPTIGNVVPFIRQRSGTERQPA